MLGIFLKQKRIAAPIRLSLNLSQSLFFEVTVAVIRRNLPKQAEDCVKWATIITGALCWCLNHPPPIRRKQFIVDLNKPYRSWVSPASATQAGIIWKKTKRNIPRQQAERITFCSNATQCEKAIALLQATILALHSKLPAMITVKLS